MLRVDHLRVVFHRMTQRTFRMSIQDGVVMIRRDVKPDMNEQLRIQSLPILRFVTMVTRSTDEPTRNSDKCPSSATSTSSSLT